MALRTILKWPEKNAQRDHTGGENAPRGTGFRGWALKTLGLKVPRSPHTSSVLIKLEEPGY